MSSNLCVGGLIYTNSRFLLADSLVRTAQLLNHISDSFCQLLYKFPFSVYILESTNSQTTRSHNH